MDVQYNYSLLAFVNKVHRRLGYRLVLLTASLPDVAEPGDELSVQFTLENQGFAGLYKERAVALVLRNSLRLAG